MGSHTLWNRTRVFGIGAFLRKSTHHQLSGHNMFFYPMSTTLENSNFQNVAKMPSNDITMAGVAWTISHQFPMAYGSPKLDSKYPSHQATGQIQPAKLNPGKDHLTAKNDFQEGGSHGSNIVYYSTERRKNGIQSFL